MAKRRLKSARKEKTNGASAVHDRRATDLPYGASVRVVTVDDPLEVGAKLKVVASLRDDPLGRLHARGQIDQAQYEAGRYWQRLWEQAQPGGVKAMDTTKEPVDGGSRVPEGITDRHRTAVIELGKLGRALGKEGDALVRDVLAHRMFMDQVAAARGITSDQRRECDYLARRFRECMETLAISLGYAVKDERDIVARLRKIGTTESGAVQDIATDAAKEISRLRDSLRRIVSTRHSEVIHKPDLIREAERALAKPSVSAA